MGLADKASPKWPPSFVNTRCIRWRSPSITANRSSEKVGWRRRVPLCSGRPRGWPAPAHAPVLSADIKQLYRLAGVDNKPTVFLFNDTQIVDESFLEDINNILSSGEVPNLYKPDEFVEVGCRIFCSTPQPATFNLSQAFPPSSGPPVGLQRAGRFSQESQRAADPRLHVQLLDRAGQEQPACHPVHEPSGRALQVGVWSIRPEATSVVPTANGSVHPQTAAAPVPGAGQLHHH